MFRAEPGAVVMVLVLSLGALQCGAYLIKKVIPPELLLARFWALADRTAIAARRKKKVFFIPEPRYKNNTATGLVQF